ncbi:MAG TPA: DUF3105 domain-containing protein [Polyangiales bacterium]|nr:DUF3105 domain-containing protein [Polyangiales bacterium]
MSFALTCAVFCAACSSERIASSGPWPDANYIPRLSDGGHADPDDAGREPEAGRADAALTDASLADAGRDADTDTAPTCAGIATTCGGCEEHLPVTSAQHLVGTIHYPDPPPAGGDHNECWGTWGVHDTPLAAEHWVHNLEHGGVVFLYDCPSGCTAEVAALAKLVNAKPRTILSLYAPMPTRFAVVSWGYRLESDCLDLDAFTAFYLAHVNQAPEDIPDNPPAGCPQ